MMTSTTNPVTKQQEGKNWTACTSVQFDNRETEIAVLYLAITDARTSNWLLDNGEPRDFSNWDGQFILQELKAMRAAGKEATNADHWQQWFSSGDCAARLAKIKVDWHPGPLALVLSAVVKNGAELPDAPDPAKVVDYLAELRLLRMARAVKTVAWQMWDRAMQQPLDPLGVVDWTEKMLAHVRRIPPVPAALE